MTTPKEPLKAPEGLNIPEMVLGPGTEQPPLGNEEAPIPTCKEQAQELEAAAYRARVTVEMLTTPGWKLMQEDLHDLWHGAQRRLVTENDPATMRYWQAVVRTIETIYENLKVRVAKGGAHYPKPQQPK